MNVINMAEYHKLVPSGKKGSKHRNVRTLYNGTYYDSKKESDYRQTLDFLTGSNIPANERVEVIEEQVRYKMIVNDVKVCTYVLDFKVTYGDGRVEFVDVKPFDIKTNKFRTTDVFKIKKRLMLACHGIDITEA